MIRKTFSHPGFIFFFTLILSGCSGGKSEIFIATEEPRDFLLKVSKPIEFEFDLEDDGNYAFSLDVTYDKLQLKGFTKLQMYYLLIWPDKHETEKIFEIPIKDDKGWMGKPKEASSNDIDYVVSNEFHKDVQLKKGHYKFRLFANPENNKDIPGMVTLLFKVLQ